VVTRYAARVSEWWRSFFDETYRRLWAQRTSEQRTAAEVDGIHLVLSRHGVTSGARILDLACGDGRISVGLAAHGYAVTGLDVSPSMLEAARVRAEAAGVALPLVEADMRYAPSSLAPLDVVISWFSSFGYFAESSGDLEVLENTRRLLAPRGLLLLDVQHRDRIAALHREVTPQRSYSQVDTAVVLEERWFDPVAGRAGEHLVVIGEGTHRETRALDVRVYTVTELIGLLRAADLHIEAVYGGPGPTPFGVDTRLLVVARRGDA
jgi:SAM-dependent methyltransferase